MLHLMLTLITILCFIGGCQPKKDNTMKNKEFYIAEKYLKLKDELYYTADQNTLANTKWDILRIKDFEGIAINGPLVIEPEQKDPIPVIAALRHSSLRSYISKFEKNSTLVISDIDCGSVKCIKAFLPEEKMRPEVNVDLNDSSLKTSYSAKITIFDLKELTDIEWEKGNYGIGLISYDFLSNSIEMKVTNVPEREIDRISRIWPMPNPLSGEMEHKKPKKAFPSYENFKNTVSPKKPGINFVIEPTDSNATAPVLYGSFLVKAKPNYLKQEVKHITLSNCSRSVCAIVPVTFIIIRNNQSVPVHQSDWFIPIYGSNKVSAGELLQGNFAISINHELKSTLLPDRYMGYMVLDGKVYGPRPFEWNP
jgi:hypothetical protein